MGRRRDDLCSSTWVRFVAKKASGTGRGRVRRIGEVASPVEERSDWYRLALAIVLFDLAAEELLSREQKLFVLCANIDLILPILLRLCAQMADAALVESVPGPLPGAAKQMRAAVQNLMELDLVAGQVRPVDDDASPAEERLEQYQLDLARLLSQLERDRLLDRERKLVVLYSNIDNILPILQLLCARIGDEALAESDVGPALAGTAKEMRAAIRDLMELDRVITVRLQRTRRRRRPRPH